jgi:hypothetical protein
MRLRKRAAHHHIEEVLPFQFTVWIKLWDLPTRLAICAFLYGCVGICCNSMMNYIMIQDWPQDIGK